jgi:hypothetical protein
MMGAVTKSATRRPRIAAAAAAGTYRPSAPAAIPVPSALEIEPGAGGAVDRFDDAGSCPGGGRGQLPRGGGQVLDGTRDRQEGLPGGGWLLRSVDGGVVLPGVNGALRFAPLGAAGIDARLSVATDGGSVADDAA